MPTCSRERSSISRLRPGYSLNHPHAYVDSNLVAFINVLEGCRHNGTEHLLFTSSSSVYGLNGQLPSSVKHNVDHPANLYAATKKANELFAHSYSSLYGLPVTGLRFFTVYGPWGRPDMVLYLFEAIFEGRPIQIFNYGRMKRDFTYVDDVVEALWRLSDRPPAPYPDWAAHGSPPDTSPGPYRLFNIGGSNPVDLMEMVRTLEAALGREADKVMLPMQAGDVAATWADVTQLNQAIGYVPQPRSAPVSSASSAGTSMSGGRLSAEERTLRSLAHAQRVSPFALVSLALISPPEENWPCAKTREGTAAPKPPCKAEYPAAHS